jgi:putative transposase
MIYRLRKRNRMLNYDYSKEGTYFLTICTYGRLQFFGKIEWGLMTLNKAGFMINQKWEEMQQFYPNIVIDAFCVMPNHIHAIVKIAAEKNKILSMDKEGLSLDGTPQGAFPTLGLPDYLDRFKSLTTRLYIDGVRYEKYIPFERHLWQKSFYDHIIKDDIEYQKILEYIKANPLNWKEDKYYITRP